MLLLSLLLCSLSLAHLPDNLLTTDEHSAQTCGPTDEQCMPKLDGIEYQAQGRQEKLEVVWKALIQHLEPLPFYGIRQLELLVENMKPSFDIIGDRMPDTLYERKKLIHTQGVIAKAKFIITNPDNPYTGIFKTGSDSALIRFSMATPPADGNFAPAISLKCMIDGRPSVNLFGLRATLTQPSANFFAHDFSNHPPSLNPAWSTALQRLVQKKLESSTQWPQMLGLSSIAQYTQDGKKEEKVNFPYRVVFHPRKDYHFKFPEKLAEGVSWSQSLIQGLEQGLVYEVYAQDKPLLVDQLTKIGEIHLTSQPTTSTYGDRHYFTQHQRMEEDLALKPEWVEATHQDRNIQASAPTSPGYLYPDLPFE